MSILDIVLTVAVAGVVAVAVWRLIRNREQGKSACGCDCASCGCGCGKAKR